MTDNTVTEIEARLREAMGAWLKVALRDLERPTTPPGEPRLSPTTNACLDYLRAHPAGIRAGDLVPLLLDPGEPLPDDQSERYKKRASVAKTILQRLAKSGRARRVSIGLYVPTPMLSELPEVDTHTNDWRASLQAQLDAIAAPVAQKVMTDAASAEGHDRPDHPTTEAASEETPATPAPLGPEPTHGAHGAPAHDDPAPSDPDDALALLLAAAEPQENR